MDTAVLLAIAGILLVLWLAGFALNLVGAFVHVLLILAIVVCGRALLSRAALAPCDGAAASRNAPETAPRNGTGSAGPRQA